MVLHSGLVLERCVSQATIPEEAPLRVFISHADAQAVLAALHLPFISNAYQHGNAGNECMVVDDDDTLAVVEVNGSISASASQAHVSHSDSLGSLRPAQPAQPAVPRYLHAMGRRTSSTASLHSDVSHTSSCTQRSESTSWNSVAHALVEIDDTDNDPGVLVEISSNTSHRKDKRWTPATLKSLGQHDYENMTPAQCAFVAAKASSALQQQTQRNQIAQQQLRSLKRANKMQEQQLVKKQRLLDDAMTKSSLQIVRIGKTKKRMSTQSIYAVGLRRNMCNIAAADLGAVLLEEMSHQRVTRAEVRTAAAALCRMRDVCSSVVQAKLMAPALQSAESHATLGGGQWQLSTVALRCDATNSSIWRREKLHVLDVDFAWVSDMDAVKKFDATKAISSVCCLSRTWHCVIVCSSQWQWA